MTLSYNWLLEYLPQPLPVDELSRILTAIGLEVEGVETVGGVKGGLEGLRIGQVLTCEPHPNADKLKLTTVSLGEGTEPLQIVCGAPNVAAGEKVVVAPVGTTVHPLKGEPFGIKKAKIRGQESAGMLCSAAEIGLSDDSAGLLLLPREAPVGALASDYFKPAPAETVLHVGLTPNRSDAASHIGAARDVCAYLTHHTGAAVSVRYPGAALPPVTAPEHPVSVRVDAAAACPRYAGLVIDGVSVVPSPDWLQQRLKAIGVRPVNNVVDVTNYVLHEFGQPLHAFDAAGIRGNEVVVGFLPDGTRFTTLDGTERTLRGTDLMICDAEGGMCIAGVFGGRDSGITEATTAVFLESAYFDPVTIRRTSLHHGLRTEAATHFEKGVDIDAVLPALERAASLILEIAGGRIAAPLVDLYPEPVAPTRVAATYEAITSLAGKAYPPAAIDAILEALGFRFENKSDDGFTVSVPSSKRDIRQVADLTEEVLRIDGLDNIAVPKRLGYALTPPRPTDRALRERVARLLIGAGFHEILTNSIVNSRWYGDRTDLVRMLNSLSSELDVLRPALLESGLEVVQYNVNRKAADLCLFEMGTVYHTDGEAGKYREEPRLGLWMTGALRPASWQEAAKPADLFALKGIIESLLRACGIDAVATQDGEQTTWTWNGTVVGTAAPVAKDRLALFSLKEPVFYADIHWPVVVKAASAHAIVFREVPRFPTVQRDLALVLDAAIRYEDVLRITRALKLPELQDFQLFDVFTGEKLGAGKKSYAVSYTFQTPDRTPTDAEIDGWMQRLTAAYRKELAAEIRS